jgi:hypothetical protein
MIVRRMSAQQTKIRRFWTAMQNKEIKEHAGFWEGTGSPKAEVTSSNLVGRAMKSIA